MEDEEVRVEEEIVEEPTGESGEEVLSSGEQSITSGQDVAVALDSGLVEMLGKIASGTGIDINSLLVQCIGILDTLANDHELANLVLFSARFNDGVLSEEEIASLGGVMQEETGEGVEEEVSVEEMPQGLSGDGVESVVGGETQEGEGMPSSLGNENMQPLIAGDMVDAQGKIAEMTQVDDGGSEIMEEGEDGEEDGEFDVGGATIKIVDLKKGGAKKVEGKPSSVQDRINLQMKRFGM